MRRPIDQGGSDTAAVGAPYFPTPTPADTSNPGGGGGGGGGGSHSTTSFNIDPNAIQNDPLYQINSAYINSSGALDKATLQQMIDIANAKFGLSSQEIAQNLADAQRNITYDLANRQATESGDTSFYHGRASQLAANQMQSAQLDLTDYLAGVQAAYAQRELDRQNSLQNDYYNAFQNELNYYTQLAGGANLPAFPGFPGQGTTPSG